MILLDGKKTAAVVKERLKSEVQGILEQGKRAPNLAAVLVGNNGASETYIASKVKACQEIGFTSTLIREPVTITEEELLQIVNDLNKDENIDGILVQLPLPKHITEEHITLAISPEKDVDGFHPENIGRLVLGVEAYTPATPLGIMMLLEEYNINTSGMHAVVIGRSAIVGTPMSLLLSRNSQPGNCTVTLTHSKTKDLGAITRQADLIVAALGIPEFLKEDMVKEGAIVVDVGITRLADERSPKGYRITGDVDFKNLAEKCSYITPVPGGVGAMTIAALMNNTLHAYKRRTSGN
jgi:methylenetetrahydrofolate dehydrogenase (NADP+) / methenyltetrahydrofolate cyclohydrolase